jgi:zinc protease
MRTAITVVAARCVVLPFTALAPPFAVAATLCVTAAAEPALVTAQQYAHPRDIRMAAPSFVRPEPAAYRQQIGDAVAYIVEDRRVPLVTVSAFVRAGYVDGATPDIARGVERALRSGPAALAPGAFDAELERMAAEWRVAMGPELTELSLDVPAEDAARAIELLVATLRAPRLATLPAGRPPSALRSDAATGESGAVLYEGSLQLAVDLFHEWLLGETPYAGFAARGAAVDSITNFHRALFGPATTVFAIAGDIAAADARRALAGALAGWSGGRTPERRALPPLPRPAGREIRVYDTDRLQGWIVMGHELAPVPARDRAALDVMNYILGGGHFDTRLFRELRDKRGLANTGGGFPEANQHGPGSYTFRTYGRPEAIPQLIELTLAEIDRMQREPVTVDELAIAKGALADGAFPMRYADGYATARSLAEEWARHGDHDESTNYVERVRQTTAEQVLDVARRYIEPERFRIVVVGPISEIERAAQAAGVRRLDAFGTVVR